MMSTSSSSSAAEGDGFSSGGSVWKAGGNATKDTEKKVTVDPFSGKGKRLDGKDNSASNNNSANFIPVDEEDEEMQIAKAISASLNESFAPSQPPIEEQKSAKEIAREKRLAALAARGL